MIITKEEVKFLLNYDKNLTKEQLDECIVNIKSGLKTINQIVFLINKEFVILSYDGNNFKVEDGIALKYIDRYRLNKLLSETLPTNKKEKRIKL